MSLEHAATAAASMPLHSGLLWLVPFLPAFGALFNGLTGRRLKSTKIVDAVALGTVGIAFLLSLYYFITLLGRAPEIESADLGLGRYDRATPARPLRRLRPGRTRAPG